MKILIAIDSFGAGGAEKSTLDFCDYLTENEIYFEIICIDKRETGFQKIIFDRGYRVHFLKSKFFIRQVFEYNKIIKGSNFKVVHSILFRSSLRVRFSKIFLNFIHLESIVSTRYSKEKKIQTSNKAGLYFYYIIDLLTSRFLIDHFHAISQTVKDHFIKELEISPNKITVIYRGREKPLHLKQWDRTANVLKIVTVGRQEVVKGQLYLFKAIKILVEKGFLVELRLLGRSGNASAQLNDYISSNNLYNVIFIEGFKNDVYSDLLKSDLFVFPSTFEGLGGALIEAQSIGLPIVCSDIPVFKEVVNQNKNAILFENKNPESIANAILFFIENKSLLEKFGNDSLLNFNDKFLAISNNSALLELIKKLFPNNFPN